MIARATMKSVVCILVLVSICSALTNTDSSSRLSLKVVLEYLCPDSIRFVQNQLKPAFEQCPNNFNIDVIAHGKASYVPNAHGGYSFRCQHGEAECRGNKALACAKKFAPNHDAYIAFVICAMGRRSYRAAITECSSGALQRSINECVSSAEGQRELKKMAESQYTVAPHLGYVPSIVVNGKHSQEMQNAAEFNLKQLVCGN